MMEIISNLWIMSLQASVLILVVLLVRTSLKKYPKIYTYCLWALVGIRLLFPIFVETPFSLQPDYAKLATEVQQTQVQQGNSQDILPGTQFGNINTSGENIKPILPEDLFGEQLGEQFGEIQTGQNDFQDVFDDRSEVGTNVGGASHNATEKQSGIDTIAWVAAIIYLAGMVGVACFYLVQYLLIRRRISTAVKDKGNVWLCEVDSPFVIGIINSRIILPYTLAGKEKEHVLKHEKTHIRHHDPFIRFVGLVCLCLHWWNPLVWLAVHKMNQDMEMFCDETALEEATAEERKSYARTLLLFAAKQSGFSVGLAFGESNTERRVKNIMNKRKGSILIISIVAILAVFCMVAFMTIPKDNDKNNGAVKNENTEETTDDESSDNNQEPTEQQTTQQQIEKQNVKDQLELIAENMDKLQLLHEWVEDVNRYAVTDLDQNGRLEVIVSNVGGTGYYTYSRFYEVNETYDGLVEYDIGFEEGSSQPDIITESVDMYYDATENMFYYIEQDTISDVTTFHNFLYAMSLSSGKLIMTPLSDMIETYPEYKVVYKDGAGKEITKAEYDELVERRFEGCDKYGANFGWQNTRELVGVTDKDTIVKMLSKSYDRFELYVNYENGTGGNNLTDEAAYNAYAAVLENLYYNHELPGGEDVGIQPYAADVSQNKFAVLDIDSDGRDELIVIYTTTYTAGQTVKVYDYDSVLNVVREQFSEYPTVTFYSNGWIFAGWSHNHGRAPMLEDFWPYRIYSYDSLEDKYSGITTVDAWDENYYNQDGSFPKEADLDGDGILYYAMSYESPEYVTPWDAKEYNYWLDACMEGAEKIDIPYMNMSLENIESIKR